MKMFATNFQGDPNIGLYGFATDGYCIVGKKLRKKQTMNIAKLLGVHVHECTVINTDFVGMFMAGNSAGVVVPKIIEEHELDALKKKFSVHVVKSRFTALGNLVLMNDKGIILSPLLKRFRHEFSGFFGIPCEVTKIANIAVVGSAAVATNKGCMAHPNIKEHELHLLEKTLGVPVNIGTAGYGSPYPGSSIMANSNGFVTSESTSGPELGRIMESLGFV